MKNYIYIVGLVTVLTMSWLSSCTEQEEEPLVKEPMPESCFNLEGSDSKVGSSVEFSNCSEHSTHFLWDFGDGQSSTQREPVHVYQTQGNYEVVLLAGKDMNQDGRFDLNDSPASSTKSIAVKPNHLAVELTIFSASDWTTEQPDLTVVPGATVLLYKTYPLTLDPGEPDYTLTADENGKVKLYDQDFVAECFIVKHGTESNVSADHYLIKGRFESQADIDNSSVQEGAVVEGLKYVDMNGDGIISVDDQVPGQGLPVRSNETYQEDVIISN